MPLSCPNLRTSLDTLSVKQKSLEAIILEAAVPGKFDLAQKLKAEMEVSIASLKESLNPILIGRAEKILGKENVITPEDIGKTFGFEIEMKEVPLLTFSKAELKAAKQRNEQLVLGWDRLPDGTLLSGKVMDEKRGGKTEDGNKLLFDSTSYQNDPFFIAEAPERGWRLTEKEPAFKKQNYLSQTGSIVAALKADPAYHTAIVEYQKKKPKIEKLWQDYDNHWPEIAEILSELAITQSTRESFAELFQRLIVTEKKTKQKLLPSDYAWTKGRSSDGYLVGVGDFGAAGVYVHGFVPCLSSAALGVSFSHREI